MGVFEEILVVSDTRKSVLIDSTVRTSLGARTQRFSSFPTTPSFRSRLKSDPEAKVIPRSDRLVD